ncbi:MAG: hypothetical protein OJF58_003738 [Enhydrobacter sp.]|nr:MAG: hypothetical protein OJF58_003738 [Enhydrobacter sp.]
MYTPFPARALSSPSSKRATAEALMNAPLELVTGSIDPREWNGCL